MNAFAERAHDYAALFTAITAGGGDWRRYVPDDGQPRHDRDQMVLDGCLVVRRDNRWDVVEPAAAVAGGAR